ncbi:MULTISPECIES: hypothetical protein [unclassified Nonomuraea]
MVRQAHTSSGPAYDLGYFLATVGAVPADTVQRYIETPYERVPKGGGARA